MSRVLFLLLLVASLHVPAVAESPGAATSPSRQAATAPDTADAQPAGTAWRRVTVAPTRTSIYIGTISMRMPPFAREGMEFVTTYTARVFPFAFYNEHGTLRVSVTDEQLASLEQGHQIEFTGIAHRSDGEVRRVTGRATPTGPHSGKLKVRVWVSKRIELIFNTTYEAVGGEG